MSASVGDNLEIAKEILLNGGIVAIPTETVYGLAAIGTDQQAVGKIFKAKERPFFDPLICHVYSISQIYHYTVSFPEKLEILAKNFWPGPLTIILKKKDIIPDIVSAGLDTVGFRIPNHPLTLDLLKSLNLPLAAPSANPFGYISPTTAQHVKNQLGNRIDYILDGGPCKVGVESTIILYHEKEGVKVLRYGGITIDQMEEIVGKIEIPNNSQSIIAAPGMLDSHYSPKKKLFLFKDIEELNGLNLQDSIVILRNFFESNKVSNSNYILKESKKIIYLSNQGDLIEIATNLFKALREADDYLADKIYCQTVESKGIGLAINDRLSRASKK